MKKQKSKLGTSVRLNYIIGFALLCAVLFITVVKFSTTVSELKKSTSNPIAIKEISEKPTGMKSYVDEKTGYSFMYPSTWTLEKSRAKYPKNDNSYVLIVSGKEGKIQVDTALNGYGGGCEIDDHKDITIFNKSREICTGTNEGNEYWSLIYEKFGEDMMGIHAEAYAPLDKNSATISAILSSFQKLP